MLLFSPWLLLVALVLVSAGCAYEAQQQRKTFKALLARGEQTTNLRKTFGSVVLAVNAFSMAYVVSLLLAGATAFLMATNGYDETGMLGTIGIIAMLLSCALLCIEGMRWAEVPDLEELHKVPIPETFHLT